jgi:hypothetical protein
VDGCSHGDLGRDFSGSPESVRERIIRFDIVYFEAVAYFTVV